MQGVCEGRIQAFQAKTDEASCNNIGQAHPTLATSYPFNKEFFLARVLSKQFFEQNLIASAPKLLCDLKKWERHHTILGWWGNQQRLPHNYQGKLQSRN